jgi:acyl carrier protein
MNEPTTAHPAAATDRAWVETVVGRLVQDIAAADVTTVEPDYTLVNDLGYNSILLIELGFALEELFELDRLSIDEAPPTSRVRDLQEYILTKIDAGTATVPDEATVDEYLSLR